GRPSYSIYGPEFMSRDLASFLEPVAGSNVSFAGKYPRDFFVARPPTKLPSWHLVGGLDLLEESELTGAEPNDGYPVLLRDWIRRDGLECLKVKLRGTDAEWDLRRLLQVGSIALEEGVASMSADFNCTVSDPEYVNGVLDRFHDEQPQLFHML